MGLEYIIVAAGSNIPILASFHIYNIKSVTFQNILEYVVKICLEYVHCYLHFPLNFVKH